MATLAAPPSSGSSRRVSRVPKPRKTYPSVQTVLSCAVTGTLCFYLGLQVGLMHSCSHRTNIATTSDGTDTSTNSLPDSVVNDPSNKLQPHHFAAPIFNSNLDTSEKRFPSSISKVAAGATLIPRDDFARAFDLGVPYDKSTRDNQHVLLLHSSMTSLPANAQIAQQSMSGSQPIPILSPEEATKQCDQLHVVLTNANNEKRAQCVALMGQYESFHISKFMRLQPEVDGINNKRGPVDLKWPLRLVNRGAQRNGRKSTKTPTKEQTLQYWKLLQVYLASLEDNLARLKPLAEKVGWNQNTIVVMVCNHGQSELLLNFVCNARSRNLDLSSVLVFATDPETLGLAQGMGLTAFYDETNFASMPKHAARAYANKDFMAMMMAKVFCVQMVSMLGYDVFFQDVDVIWFKNPLDFFHDPKLSKDFDMYFQDDGNHALYYAPYSANTGCYYVRNNVRTEYFLNSFLLAGDLIVSTRSHQVALIAVLNEHASMYGMKIKILSRDTTEFPGGFHFHRRRDFMKKLIQGKDTTPYLFHMSWTINKRNKLYFFRQMGEFYVEEKCIGSTAEKIVKGHVDTSKGDAPLVQPCCSAEPLVSCHFRDKPSKIPCPDSPNIDKRGRPFW